ncbi:MAG: membrane protein insertion efficiency factor YidD [Clostridia bacterium]
MKFIEIVFYPFKMLALGFVWFWQKCISPFLPHTCRFFPSCSAYAKTAIKNFGFFGGGWLAFKRLLRCAPHNKGGFDPVPNNIKGAFKWLV